MLNKIDNLINDMKKDYSEVEIPNEIDDFIKKGMKKGKTSKFKYSKSKCFKIAVCISLAVFLISIRVSTTFASYLKDVPILSYIVELVNDDKGLKSAVENNYMQHIGKYDEKHNIKFSVDDVIADEDRMIIFYSIENKSKDGFANLLRCSVNTGDNNLIPNFNCLCCEGNKINKNLIRSTINISFNKETKLSDSYTIKPIIIKSKNEDYIIPKDDGRNFSISEGSEIYKDFIVSFSIDKSKFKYSKKNYNINKTVNIENQKIKFSNAVISPTRIALKIEYDPSNTKRVLNFDDLKIVDENGKIYGSIPDGMVSESETVDGIKTNEILYLESNYFENPKSLFITFSSVRAIDKDKIQVKLDLNNKKFITKPDDNLILHGITKKGESIFIDYNVNTDSKYDNGRTYQIFAGLSFIDSTGKTFKYKGIGINKNDGIIIEIPNEHYKNPIILTINDYPARIEKNIKIKIK